MALEALDGWFQCLQRQKVVGQMWLVRDLAINFPNAITFVEPDGVLVAQELLNHQQGGIDAFDLWLPRQVAVEVVSGGGQLVILILFVDGCQPLLDAGFNRPFWHIATHVFDEEIPQCIAVAFVGG